MNRTPLGPAAALVTASVLLLLTLGSSPTFVAAEPIAPAEVAGPRIIVPEGFNLETVAAPPLVGHPMMGCFDDRGRLYLSESAGFNLDEKQLDAQRPNFIRRLEDTNGDGTFDKSTIFADKLMIPNGAQWYEGSLYVAEPPGIWRFTDTNDDGVADRREHIAGNVKSNGMSSTLHGPTLHPSGRLCWCGGQMGYSLDREGTPSDTIAPGVFMLRPDGSEHEVFSVGGNANPVEVTFNHEGDVFGTLAILDYPDGARHDALLHWIFGGIYPHRNNVLEPLKSTGPQLPPLSHVGQVAPAGLIFYRGTMLGEEYRGNLLWSQFNTHKVVRTRVSRQGATFKSEDTDFLISEDVNFHPTDVIEDADGSLLVIDTGGWFRHGCPTSSIANKDALGAIYRIRRTGASPVNDPRGGNIPWAKLDPAKLVALFDDARPAVVDRAMAEFARQHKVDGIPALRDALGESATMARQNAVWTLARIDSADAHTLLRQALDDKVPGVRQAAAQAVGLARDPAAVNALRKLVAHDDDLAVRREAATALGRIRAAESVLDLLATLDTSNDPFLQHSVIYALISIGQVDPLIAGLADSQVRVQRGALLALSQLDGFELDRKQIAPLLRSNDLDLRKAAFLVAARMPPLLSEALAALKGQLSGVRGPLDDAVANVERDALTSLASKPEAQQLVTELLKDDNTAESVRLLLLEVIRNSASRKRPDKWLEALGYELQKGTPASRLQAIEITREQKVLQLDDALLKIARDPQALQELRLACLTTAAPRISPVPDELFQYVIGILGSDGTPLAHMAAARTLASLPLSDEQLLTLSAALGKADPLVLPTLLQPFGQSASDAVGQALIASLTQVASAAPLPKEELVRILGKYPDTTLKAAQSLLKKIGVDPEQQRAQLESLHPLLAGGDILRGKQVFFGKLAACSACHRVSGQGGLVGPNLSAIAEIRTGRDLLESITFPSASIVQGFRPLVVLDTNGRTITGILTRQTPDAMWLRTAELAEVKVDKHDIDSMSESSLSIMPQGLTTKLKPEELRDLLAFLQSLKPSSAFRTDR